MSSKEVVKHLNIVLAETYALYLKTQNCHWNVTGPNFHSLHSMFEEQYKELETFIPPEFIPTWLGGMDYFEFSARSYYGARYIMKKPRVAEE